MVLQQNFFWVISQSCLIYIKLLYSGDKHSDLDDLITPCTPLLLLLYILLPANNRPIQKARRNKQQTGEPEEKTVKKYL